MRPLFLIFLFFDVTPIGSLKIFLRHVVIVTGTFNGGDHKIFLLKYLCCRPGYIIDVSFIFIFSVLKKSMKIDLVYLFYLIDLVIKISGVSSCTFMYIILLLLF